MTQLNKFSQQAKLGKNDWWRYLLGFSLILISWLVIGGVFYSVFQVYLIKKYTNTSQEQLMSLFQTGELVKINELFQQAPAALQAITFISSFIFGLLALLFVVKVIHRRAIKTLFTPRSKFSYSRFFQGFIVYLVITASIALIYYLFGDKTGVEITFNPNSFFVLLLVACFLLPLQVLFEELFFRGYLLQFLGLKIKNIWSLTITTGVIFTIFHLANPEIKTYGAWIIVAAYLIPGLFFAWITLLDNRLELSLAAHLANNFFVLVIMAPQVSVLVGEPIFTMTEIEQASPLSSLISLTRFGLFCFYFFVIRKPKHLRTGSRSNQYRLNSSDEAIPDLSKQ